MADLAEQSFPQASLEVLVADDSSGDETERLAREGEWPFALRYIRGSAEGAVGARNLGVSLARGRYVVLLDDDILVDREFLTEMTAEMARHPQAVVIGTLVPYTAQDEQTPFRTLYSALSAPSGPGAQSSGGGFTHCLAGLLGIRREAYWQLGGMRSIGGDNRGAWTDVLFGYQAAQHGMEVRVCRQAIARHDDHALASLETTCRLARRSAREAVAMFQEYPEMSTQLPMFRDKLPVRWGEDGAGLVLRKWARQAASTGAALEALGAMARFLEQHLRSVALLRPLYRWIIGGNICRGYREGVRAMEAGELPTGEKAC